MSPPEIIRLETLARRPWPRPSVTVGNFDGVHRGHQALVRAALEAARRERGSAIALTFDPHPSHVLSPHRAPGALMTLEQKAEVLGGLGIERVAVLPFTKQVAEREADAFASDVLLGCLGARTVVVGANFRFGRHRAGDAALLARLGQSLGFDVLAVDAVIHEGFPISSTRIREALARGEIESASALLGRLPFIDGVVQAGAGRGRTLGFPTANLTPRNDMLFGGGVYASWVRLDAVGPLRPAVVNIGRRPTFGGGDLLLEAHLLDFAEDLYERRLRVELVQKLRDERPFADPEELRQQIASDIASARKLLSSSPGSPPRE